MLMIAHRLSSSLLCIPDLDSKLAGFLSYADCNDCTDTAFSCVQKLQLGVMLTQIIVAAYLARGRPS